MSDSVTHKEQIRREAAAAHMKNLVEEGKLPANQDLTKGIDKFQNQLHETKPKLSETGQRASESVASILETAKEIIETKNENEHLQKSFYHMYQAGKDQPMSARFGKFTNLFSPNDDVKQLQSEARQHVDSLLTIVKLAIMSGEFRETLNEFFQFFSSLLRKRSKKLEKKFHESAGRPLPGGVDKSSIVAGQEDTKTKLIQQLHPGALPHELRPQDSTHNEYEPEHHYKWIEKGGAYELERISDEESEKSQLSQEREEKLINRLVDLLQRVHNYSEFSNSVEFLSDSLKTLTGNWRENVDHNSDVVQIPESQSAKMHMKASRRELIEFIESWIGEGYSLDPLIESVLRVRDIVQHDPELHKLFHDLRTFFTKSAKDSDYVNDKQKVRHDAKDLIERSRHQLMHKHRGEFQRLKREVLFINNAIQHDDSLLKLRDDVKDLVKTLTTDANGKPTIKPELLSDAQYIIQALFDTIKYLPLPPIEKEDENGTFRMENIVINCKDILPSQIRISTTLDATGKDGNNSAIEIRLRHIRAHLRNAKFFIHKRSGFPHIKESGLVDVDLAGKKGMDIFISVSPDFGAPGTVRDANVSSLFKVNECTCSISKLRLRLRDTKHDALYKFVSPVINAIARRRIETLVQEQIGKAINGVNKRSALVVNKASERGPEVAAKAKETAGKARDKAVEKKEEAKAKKEAKEHATHTHDTHGTHTHTHDTHGTHGTHGTSHDAHGTHGTHTDTHATHGTTHNH